MANPPLTKAILSKTIASLLCFLPSYTLSAKNNIKFEWTSSESAPAGYPMEIIKGTFIYKGEAENGLYIPSGGTLKAGWGTAISMHIGGPDFKPLPDRLRIVFFSYAEKQFYEGEFDLPYNIILKLFREGIEENRDDPSYTRIVAGIAPGGVVAVWLKGQKAKEVFFGQAEKVELNPNYAFGLPFESKEESDRYIQEGLEEAVSPEQLQKIQTEGIPFGLWERYRKRYPWQVTSTSSDPLSKLTLSFFNGEYLRHVTYTSNLPKDNMFPASDHISLISNNVIYKADFDEQEILEAFDKLGSANKMIQLEFTLKYPRSQSSVRLHTEDESISLTKAVFKDW